MQVRFEPRTTHRFLAVALITVALAGLAVELAYDWQGRPKDRYGRSEMIGLRAFSLSYEHNVPTWYSASLLLLCSVSLGIIAADRKRSSAPYARHWKALAIIFLYISMDEAVSIHENLTSITDDAIEAAERIFGRSFEHGGVFYYSWVIPAGLLVGIFGLSYLGFLKHLSPAVRKRFVLAGSIYVFGALFMDIVLGVWVEHQRADNLGYALIDFVEETLEMLGLSIFLATLLGVMREDGGGVDFVNATEAGRGA